MPTRHESSAGYRYGFNGKANANTIKGTGNSIDFGARMYDPRVGRWFAVDPLFKDYPHSSPYNYTANNPILFIDIDGEKFGDYAIRFTNTLLKSLNKTLETGAGQHGRDKGKKPPKEDVSPLKDLEEENNSDK
jgi:RHS repeat-associated protein